MGKTDMSYYKDLLLRIGGATLGSKAGGRSTLVGSAAGAKALKDKIIKKKKGGKVK